MWAHPDLNTSPVAVLSLTSSIIVGTFAKLRKATLSRVMSLRLSVYLSVRQSVRMEQPGSNRTGFHEIWYLSIFRKWFEKIQVLLKCDKNNRHFTWIKAIPLQAWTGTESSRRLRLPDFKTIGTWMWYGCQHYAPAAFTSPPPVCSLRMIVWLKYVGAF